MGAELSLVDYYTKIARTFEYYERCRDAGMIRNYGITAGESLCLEARLKQHLLKYQKGLTEERLCQELFKTFEIAERVGGAGKHGFKFLEIPFNNAARYAGEDETQTYRDKQYTVLALCKELGINVSATNYHQK